LSSFWVTFPGLSPEKQRFVWPVNFFLAAYIELITNFSFTEEVADPIDVDE